MKLNWGWGIALAYSIFALSLLGFLVFALRQDNSLVVEDYYQQDLDYQQRKDKVRNYRDAGATVLHEYDRAADRLTLRFPEGLRPTEGEVLFYRPSSARQDHRVALRTDSAGVQEIPLARLIPGNWKLQLEWVSAGKGYLLEDQLLIAR